MVSTAAFHARVRGSVPGLGGLKETKLFLPHPRVKVTIVGSLRDREVACSASDRQGSNFESCVWRIVSSQSSHHPQEVLLAQFSLYVHKGGLKPDSFIYRDPQLQMTENLCDLWNLSTNIYECFKSESIFYFEQLVIEVVVKTQNVYCSRHQCWIPAPGKVMFWSCWLVCLSVRRNPVHPPNLSDCSVTRSIRLYSNLFTSRPKIF